MKNTDIFDVLVVYTSNIAISASSKQLNNGPFPTDSKYFECNDTYGYFLEQCNKLGMTAAFTTSADVVSAGKCKSYWIYENKKWIRVLRKGYAEQIFEKFQPSTEFQVHKREILFSSSHVKPFTDPYIFTLFSDKQKTYDVLAEFAIPTVTIAGNSPEYVDMALNDIQDLISNHPNKDDFLPKYILKDRFGAAGSIVFQIPQENTQSILKIINTHKKVSFVLQPFLQFDSGYKYNNFIGPTEIRLLFHKNKIVQTYIRVAPDENSLCNDAEGVIEITRQDIPPKIIGTAKKINNVIKKKDELYALDFVVSNNGTVYLLEANSSPGIDWHSQRPGNVAMNKKTINRIIKELSTRVDNSKASVFEDQMLIDSPTKLSYKHK